MDKQLTQRQYQPNRHAVATREFGLAACRGLIAFGRGEHERAIALLGDLPAQAHRLGGSHAQRDVLHLTLLHAVEAVRRPRVATFAARLAAPFVPSAANAVEVVVGQLGWSRDSAISSVRSLGGAS